MDPKPNKIKNPIVIRQAHIDAKLAQDLAELRRGVGKYGFFQKDGESKDDQDLFKREEKGLIIDRRDFDNF